ncbi:unnamed protein product [Colletotrichum noveboracense]|uniref:Uncharacterized protein n=1 Tax=Colletotrichum noveboracense TaxID=2664923 RepID=A0A9W4S0Y3_9PEZI|nr:unnamed protein product [Colletotrichum noveboracense]
MTSPAAKTALSTPTASSTTRQGASSYLELDLKTRPPRDTWVEEKGKRRRSKSGRHRNCERPNRFYPDDDDVAEEPIMDFEDGPTMEGV